ncbi:DNA-binding transcriptional regulator, LysR family [Pseudomonas sp. ok272]|uniref:LysR family transcriptional regulator n=1 Tax=unclassified Pseudomonas TaxID=196821 RepID=UPI0008C8D4BB|nr:MULTISPECIES: LysR family transcriptional regulator [unclassified Pseudomonas]SEN20172.1 DNA-binding transcriptional regulator, LysR family [Pseudomonas sp. ok272]SFN12211.1 DNA-binding transcriptional regulator, LysR family [Pseudomonas sp. ok602]
MELSQLTMFKVVAEQGSIIRASELLHCVPSNITNRIKTLEKELGVSLFIRSGRGLIISPSGELFLSYTHKILSLCQEARRAIDPGAAPSGTLKIGAIESSATGRLPTLLSKYHQRYPSVQMQLSTGTWTQLSNDVRSHKLDGAVIAIKNEHPDIECVEIYKEELVIIASPAMKHIKTPQDLSGKNIFMWPEGCPYRKALENWLDKHRISTTITSIASYGTILGCISAEAGVSLVPKGIFDKFKLIGNINGYTFTDLTPIQNYFIWSKHTGTHRAKDTFAEMLKDEFENI